MDREQLKRDRAALGISQSRLARLAGLRRFKVVFFELGDRSLSAEDQASIRTALRAAAQRLAGVASEIGNQLGTGP